MPELEKQTSLPEACALRLNRNKFRCTHLQTNSAAPNTLN